MISQEQYNKLLKYRKEQPIYVIKNKKRMAWEYFRKIVPVRNLEKNIINSFTLFYAPVKKIKGTNMTCLPFRNGAKEIYIDELFAINNPKITNIQTTHEVLHGLSQLKDGNQFCFGHKYQSNGQSIYTGIDEATTQLFTEDIEHQRLIEDEDYLYFLKNIMRIMKIIFGVEKLANQYLNNNNQFEESFNKLTNVNFFEFARDMNEIYIFSKDKYYGKLNEKDNILLNNKKSQIINFVKSLINLFVKDNPQIIEEIMKELKLENLQDLSEIEISSKKI